MIACGKGLTLYHTILALKEQPVEHIVGKGENAGDQHFLLGSHVAQW